MKNLTAVLLVIVTILISTSIQYTLEPSFSIVGLSVHPIVGVDFAVRTWDARPLSSHFVGHLANICFCLAALISYRPLGMRSALLIFSALLSAAVVAFNFAIILQAVRGTYEGAHFRMVLPQLAIGWLTVPNLRSGTTAGT